MIALVDIDGTLADIGHRLHFIGQGNGRKREYIPEKAPVDWEGFYSACNRDKPIEPICDMVVALSKVYTIVYVTGRPHTYGDKTRAWLDAQGLPMGALYMRKEGDHRQDYIVKQELYEKMILPDIGRADLAIEDRKQVVDMWRSLGIICLQCKEGDY